MRIIFIVKSRIKKNTISVTHMMLLQLPLWHINNGNTDIIRVSSDTIKEDGMLMDFDSVVVSVRNNKAVTNSIIVMHVVKMLKTIRKDI